MEIPGGTNGVGRPRRGWRGDLVTALLGFWLMIGLFVDGWAHTNLAALETFFTPWHALFYSGFLATAAWMLWPVWGSIRAGRSALADVPVGYDLGVVGVLVFAIGGVGDMLWHTAFGIEQDIKALLSPTHVILFLGAMLIVTSPFRAAWAADVDDSPSLKAFLPALISITLATGFVAFMFMYLWGFFSGTYIGVEPLRQWAQLFVQAERTSRVMQNVPHVRGISNILVSNLVLLAPVLLMLRRWRLPFGSVTILWTITTVLMASLGEFRVWGPIVVALVSGLAADWLIAVLRPSPERITHFRAFATVVPLVLWGLYFLEVQRRLGVAWSPELWAGVIAWTGIAGLGLSLIMVPQGVRPQIINRG